MGRFSVDIELGDVSLLNRDDGLWSVAEELGNTSTVAHINGDASAGFEQEAKSGYEALDRSTGRFVGALKRAGMTGTHAGAVTVLRVGWLKRMSLRSEIGSPEWLSEEGMMSSDYRFTKVTLSEDSRELRGEFTT